MSGFIPKAEKSIWIPVHNFQYLVVYLNSIDGTVHIPEQRLTKVLYTISEIFLIGKVHRRVPVRKVDSFVKQIISMTIVIGQVTEIMILSISIDILNDHYWESNKYRSKDNMVQIQFWKDNLLLLNIKDMLESHKCSKIVYSDASSTGFGGYEVTTINGTAHDIWSEDESIKTSTWRERMEVLLVLRSLSHI